MKMFKLLFIPVIFVLCLIPFVQIQGNVFALHPTHIAMPGFFLLSCVCFYAKGPKFVLYSAWIPFILYALLLFVMFYARGLSIYDLATPALCILVLWQNYQNIRHCRN